MSATPVPGASSDDHESPAPTDEHADEPAVPADDALRGESPAPLPPEEDDVSVAPDEAGLESSDGPEAGADDRDAPADEATVAASAEAGPVKDGHDERAERLSVAPATPPAVTGEGSAGNEDAAPAIDDDPQAAGASTTGPSTTGAERGPGGWRGLGSALRPRLSRSQVLAGVLCAALGFALVVQVQQSASDQLSTARQEDLVRLLDEVTDRAEQLADEITGLESTRDELVSGSGKAQSALELAEQRAESEGILSGRLPAEGPGVRVRIADPSGLLEASQLFNVLEELRNAGAEVVELNGVRLVTSTWFTDSGDAIVVDGETLAPPYVWTVIGDPETMDRALEIPGGALATVRTAGAEATTTRRDHVEITAVREPSEPEYATPQPREE